MLVVRRVNDARMQHKLRAMTAAQRNATRQGVAAGAGEILRWLNILSPRDTHRYVRGWQQAHQQLAAQAPVAGPAPPLSAITPSRYYTRNAARIRKQAVYWETVLRKWEYIVEKRKFKADRASYTSGEISIGEEDWYGRGSRRVATEIKVRDSELDKRYRDAVKTRDKVKKIAERARAALEVIESEAGSYAIVIGGKQTKSATASSRLSRVLGAPYGGTARFLGGGSRHFVEVKNLEAHARIVGARTGVVRRCLSMAKINGVVAVRGAYARQLTQASRALP
jgi:hypothetical protein